MQKIVVDAIGKRFDAVTALDDVSFGVETGQLFCVLGPTNAGKSTLLKTIAGLYRADRGEIVIDGEAVNNLLPHERRVSLLFQNMALFPTLTGFQNIAFPLRTGGLAESEIREKVRAIARLLKIEHILNRRPATFSGGEQQRVAIGRALIQPGRVLMLDEPLTNLDARLRIELRIEFKKLHKELGQTIIYVTHDQVEAMSLSDRIAILDSGRLHQVGTPNEVYHTPANRFVAEFIGSPPMNLMNAELSEKDSTLYAIGKGFAVPISSGHTALLNASPPRKGIAVGIRPENIEVGGVESTRNPIAANVMWVESLGSKSILSLQVGDALVRAVVKPTDPIQKERRAWIGFPLQAQHILDRGTDCFVR